LFENDGKGRFHLIADDNPDLCGVPEVARSLCAGDIDNDGDMDLLATTTAGPARLYRNTAVRKGHWLIVRPIDPQLKREAYGAIVACKAGTRVVERLVNPGTSYQCSHDPRGRTGLGDAERFDELRCAGRRRVKFFQAEIPTGWLHFRKGRGRRHEQTLSKRRALVTRTHRSVGRAAAQVKYSGFVRYGSMHSSSRCGRCSILAGRSGNSLPALDGLIRHWPKRSRTREPRFGVAETAGQMGTPGHVAGGRIISRTKP
jgi:hypothetical protein